MAKSDGTDNELSLDCNKGAARSKGNLHSSTTRLWSSSEATRRRARVSQTLFCGVLKSMKPLDTGLGALTQDGARSRVSEGDACCKAGTKSFQVLSGAGEAKNRPFVNLPSQGEHLFNA